MKSFRLLALAGFAGGLILGALPGCGTAKTCNLTTCSSGCCDATGTCQLGSNSAACGTAGVMCQACLLGQVCSLGHCLTQGTGGGNGGGVGGGNGGGNGGGSGGGNGGGVGGGNGGGVGGGGSVGGGNGGGVGGGNGGGVGGGNGGGVGGGNGGGVGGGNGGGVGGGNGGGVGGGNGGGVGGGGSVGGGVGGGGGTNCNSTNCTGCCLANGQCQTSPNDQQCGFGGNTCQACGTGNSCSAGVCCNAINTSLITSSQGLYVVNTMTGSYNALDELFGTASVVDVLQYIHTNPGGMTSTTYSSSTTDTNCEPCVVYLTQCPLSGGNCASILIPQTGSMLVNVATASPDAGTFSGSVSSIKLIEWDTTNNVAVNGGACKLLNGTHNFSASW